MFIDERSLWPGGDLVTAELVVRTAFLDRYPDTVRALLDAHLDALVWAQTNPSDARAAVTEAIRKRSGVLLAPSIIDAAWSTVRLTNDPGSASFARSTDDAFHLGFLRSGPVGVNGLVALGPLNEVLQARGLAPIAQ